MQSKLSLWLGLSQDLQSVTKGGCWDDDESRNFQTHLAQLQGPVLQSL